MLAVAGLGLSACSVSVPLGGIGAHAPDPQVTGSIAPAAAAPVGSVDSAPLPALPGKSAEAHGNTPSLAFAAPDAGSGTPFSPADWIYARGALGLALSGTADGPAVPWANPETGTYGSFAPTAPAFAEGGSKCRAFVADRVKAGSKQHFAGQACRDDSGAWSIASISSAPSAL